MSKKYTLEEIKNRLSNISEAIGNIALDYITELEKENMGLKTDNIEWQKESKKWENKFYLTNYKLAGENIKLELKIKHITENLEPQAMTALFKQIEEEFKQEQNLIEAKEFIKLLLWDLRNKSYDPVVDVERAEQFLKEVDK